MATNTRDELQQVINQLPDEQIPSVLAFARLIKSGRVDMHVAASMGIADAAAPSDPQFSDEELADDPMLRVLAAAPEDDEPLSDDEAASVAEGLAEYKRGAYVSASVAKRAHLQ